MKQLFRNIEVKASGGTVDIDPTDMNAFYLVSGSDVTLTSSFTINATEASRASVIKIYWTQKVTIGMGCTVTILGNRIDVTAIDNMLMEFSYNGDGWTLWGSENGVTIMGNNLDRVCWVKPLSESNSPVQKIFKTVAEAHTYLGTLTGANILSAEQPYTIILSSGLIDEDITTMQYVNYQLQVGTRLKSITSGVTFASNFFDCTVFGGTILQVNAEGGTVLSLKNCTIENINQTGTGDAEIEAENCTILGGDFNEITSIIFFRNFILAFMADVENLAYLNSASNCGFTETPLYKIKDLPKYIFQCVVDISEITTGGLKVRGGHLQILAASFTDKVTFNGVSEAVFETAIFDGILSCNNSKITADVVVFDNEDSFILQSTINADVTINGDATLSLYQARIAGATELNDTSILKINEGSAIVGAITKNDSATVEDKRYVISGNDATANVDNVGMMRYRVTATDSYCEMVMQTADSTYEWVVIVENNWGS